MPLTLLWKLAPAIGALVLIAIAFIAGVRYNEADHVREKADLALQAQKQLQAEIDRKHQLALEYEKKLQDMAGKVRTIVKTVEKEVEKPIYKECVLPVTGVAAINNAAKTLNETREMDTVNKTVEKLNKERDKK